MFHHFPRTTNNYTLKAFCWGPKWDDCFLQNHDIQPVFNLLVPIDRIVLPYNSSYIMYIVWAIDIVYAYAFISISIYLRTIGFTYLYHERLRIYYVLFVYYNDGCSIQKSVSFLSMSQHEHFLYRRESTKKSQATIPDRSYAGVFSAAWLGGMLVVCSQCFGVPGAFLLGLFGVVEDVEGYFVVP